jgi:hypothetical protein
MIDEYYTFEFFGYYSDDLKPCSRKPVVCVCDECGAYTKKSMHHYRDLCLSCAHKTKFLSDETLCKSSASAKNRVRKPLTKTHRYNISRGHNKKKEPLPSNYEIDKNSKIAINKLSTLYLGVYVAERVLSKVFKDVKIMPSGNRGYDFICNHGKKIDVKSSATGHKGRWMFTINKNQIADYFLCLAFESRDDLYNPVHLWMIPGHIINHKPSVSIGKTTIDKWSKYELPLNNLVVCCNNLSNNRTQL